MFKALPRQNAACFQRPPAACVREPALSVCHKLKLSQRSRGINWSFKPLHSLIRTVHHNICCRVVKAMGFVSASVCFWNARDKKSQSDHHLPPALKLFTVRFTMFLSNTALSNRILIQENAATWEYTLLPIPTTKPPRGERIDYMFLSSLAQIKDPRACP